MAALVRSWEHTQIGDLLWQPDARRIENANLTRFLGWLRDKKGKKFDDYQALHAYSVTEVEAFWLALWEFFEIRSTTPVERVLSARVLPGAHWFEGAHLNFADHCLSRRDDALAVIAISEDESRQQITYKELAALVARARAGLKRLGVGVGDRVAALLPNGPEALIAFLATASLGAIWSSCAPEFGVPAVLDRFTQIEPKVLFAIDGYRYGGKEFKRLEALEAIVAKLPSLLKVVLVERDAAPSELPRAESFAHFMSESAPLEFEAVPFEHPLWILYSSGTTGLPKPIVHGHGGILLELNKALSLHCDLRAEDRFFWYSTTGWMMWNFLVGGLLVGCTLVLYDGSPAYPDISRLWRLAQDEGVTFFGVSAPFLQACQKAEIVPGRDLDLSRLRAIGTTGAPLPADGFGWVYANAGATAPADVLLASVSGGTDVCTAFAISCPLLPVYAGELQCAALGAKLEAFDTNGHSVIGEVGELVLTEPLPSMPLFFWGDTNGERLRDSYFSAYPGVWRHGDWVAINERGGMVISGRSDSTLNRGGVRMGTSEFYRVVEALPEVVDSLVVDTSSVDEPEGKLFLFLVLAPGLTLGVELEKAIKRRILTEISPRHVPDVLQQILEVPRTLSGKKLEVPIKKILMGQPLEGAVSRDTLKNPAALEFFERLALRAPRS
ncbi:MAG: acetoacetate--CoA ligase [Polyangiaceae bacterium]|nr:acetoacetate--CoA ligase [Polyangiaceae bacterium]